MASAKPGVHVVQLKPIVVPDVLKKGEKCVKWDDDSAVGTPVTLQVDDHGFFLHWTDQNKETEMLEISCIRDTRTGRYAKIPKDSKLRDTVSMMGPAGDSLEDKTLTVVYGTDFANVSFINFCLLKKDVVKLWAEELMSMAYNLLALNASPTTFLRKAYTKLTLIADSRTGNIPVKHLVKTLSCHRDDRKRVEKALDLAGFPAGRDESIPLSKFSFDDFFNFYRNLTARKEVERIFEELCEGNRKKYLTTEQVVSFLNQHQRDPRLNEILYPYATLARARELINLYEPNRYSAQKGQLTVEGFLRYLMGDDNAIISPEKLDLSDDMSQPLPHYFLNSSHNTYLTGHQLTGKAAVEMYRQCLLAGCRCVELDFWNGRTEEPVIVHGYTLVPEIPAKDVIEAIAETAFKTSEFPVILSFENHCNNKQQAKIAQYCREAFGSSLLDKPLEDHPLGPGLPLPSPKDLIRKIIIKNKKKHYHRGGKRSRNAPAASQEQTTLSPTASNDQDSAMDDTVKPRLEKDLSKDSSDDNTESLANGEVEDDDDSDSDDDEEDEFDEKAKKDKGTAGEESEAGAEISALVNYIQPVHFHSFEVAEKRTRYYEMSSFVETQATSLLKEHPVEFVNYNKRQLSRVYPKGTRVDSSNFMPQVFWNAGCQMVALNFQTLDLAMQLNMGIFEFNCRCGFLLKPDFMRRWDRKFDPFAESTVDGIIAGSVSVQVISGQFLSDKKVSTYVEVDMYGLPADTVKRRFRTKVIPNNGINPFYDEEPFIFKKVVLPELAVLRFAVFDESGKLLGNRVLPVVGLRPGLRHIALRNESGQPQGLATLFVRLRVSDYVPDTLSDFAEALANPIKYQSDLEKRELQLRVLTDEDGATGDHQPQDGPIVRSSQENPRPSPLPVPPVLRSPQTSPCQGSSAESGGGGGQVTPQGSLTESIHEGPENGSPGPHHSTPLNRRQNSTKLSPRLSSDDVEISCAPFLLETTNMEAEPLCKLKGEKSVIEKRLELEKKLASVRKKHEKDREKEKLKAQGIINKQPSLVKKISGRVIRSKKPSGGSFSSMDESSVERDDDSPESLHQLYREQFHAEKEVFLKYKEQELAALEKVMKSSQARQLRQLKDLQDRDIATLMRQKELQRRQEMRALAVKHRDKDELARVKREVSNSMVDQVVDERKRLGEAYERKREELEVQHEAIRRQFHDEKAQAFQEWELQMRERLEEGIHGQKSASTQL